MIAERMRRVVDVLFNSIERGHKVGFLVDKKSAPQGHALDVVIFKLSAFLKKETNVISKRSGRVYRTPRVGERVKPENLGPSFSLST